MAKSKNPRPVKSKKQRQVKKQASRTSEKILRASGFSTRQIKSLPASVRNDPQKAEKAARKKTLLDSGVPESIIELSDLTSKELSPKSITDYRNQGLRLNELNRLGITDFKKSDLRLSWPRFMEKYPEAQPPEGYKIRGTAGNKTQPKKPSFNSAIRLSGNTYLYIGAAEVRIGFSMENLSDISDDRLIELINERMKDADKNPDDSDDLYCIFRVHVGSRSECEAMAEFYYKRGYNFSSNRKGGFKERWVKVVKERYMKITISNTFSQREFHEMIYNCLSQMKNDDVESFMDNMTAFCHLNHFPFIDNLLK